MARKRKELPVLTNIEITDFASEGKSVAKVKLRETDENPMVIFIPYGAPGDIVDIKIDKKKHNYAEGHIVSFNSESAIRIKPVCDNFTLCGGCKWQHIPYSEQIKFKYRQVKDLLERIGKIELPEIKMTLPAIKEWRYRNKMEYTFSNKRWRSWEEMKNSEKALSPENALGFHIPGAFDKVLQINECFLQDEMGDRIRNFIYEYAITHELSFYNIKENHGLLRTLMLRINLKGEIMVCISFGEDKPEEIKNLLEAVKEKFPEIVSIVYVVNKKLNDSISDQEIIPFYGNPYIEEEMEGLKFRVNAKSFYQTNSLQAYELYKVARRFSGIDDFINLPEEEKPLVYDLYTGAGTIANFVARGARKVIGIEYIEEAVIDARVNSEINNIRNTEFFAGDMKDILTDEFISVHGRPDIMIVDPPRAGIHEDVIDVILNAAPPIIVYISCNPATQARDLSLLDKKYRVTEVQPVDMFPHTHHVENVVKLVLKPQS